MSSPVILTRVGCKIAASPIETVAFTPSACVVLVSCGTLRGGFKPGPYRTQYKEFERSAKANGFKMLPPDDMTATLTGLCNPNVPTGDYMPVEKLKVKASLLSGSPDSCSP